MKNRYIDGFHKLDSLTIKFRTRCKCGHSVCNAPGYKKEYIICNWCGSRVYKDPKKQDAYDMKVRKNEFRYELTKSIKEICDREKKAMKAKEKRTRTPRVYTKSFKNNNGYFDFLEKNDVSIITLEFNDKGYIRIKFNKKQGRPRKENKNGKSIKLKRRNTKRDRYFE